MEPRAEGRLDRPYLDRRERRCDLYRRIFDITVSLVLGLTVLPIVLLAAIGSAISLRAWPFFVQERVGRDGEAFRFVKVRTLPPHAPSYTDKHQLKHVDIPPFCAALRRLHLDELPQLWLVLRGHMSLVGPRPEMRYLHDQLPPAFAELRTSTRPGCTGLWQVSEACDDLIGTAPQYDEFYLANRSLRLDLWVLVRTAAVMTGLAQTVRLADVPSWTGSTLATTVIDLTDGADPIRDLAASQAG
jgi:lipopolysaccharide/colanic/teichoic acid biosynthesis glycosyltransferase